MAHGIPFLFKQWGQWLPGGQDGALIVKDGSPSQVLNCGHNPLSVGKKKAGRLLDGREWSEFPKMLEAGR